MLAKRIIPCLDCDFGVPEGRVVKGIEFKQKKLLAELLNKNQLYVNLSEMDDEDFAVSKEDRELNRLFYGKSYNG